MIIHHLFTREGEKIIPTPQARGGQRSDTVHGAAVTCLLAHALQNEAKDPDLGIVRVTADLFYGVPFGPPLTTRTTSARNGNRIRVLDTEILAEGRVVARASAMLLRKTPGIPAAITIQDRPPIPHWSTLKPRRFGPSPDGQTRYHREIEVRYTKELYVGSKLAAWIKVPLLLFPDRPMTPFERLAIQSEFANGMGQTARTSQKGFINGDVTLYVLREPESEWLCMETSARADDTGLAIVNMYLHDERGLVGYALVGALANEVRDPGQLYLMDKTGRAH